MTSTGNRFEYFSVLHHDFSELYPAVNQRIINLYTRPRSFILETGPVIDGFLQTYSIPGQPGSNDMQARSMLEFINEVDEFTRSTMRLFAIHKLHVDRCSDYMQTIARLDALDKGRLADKNINEYINLTPQLIELQNGLRELADNAKGMTGKLNALEHRWSVLREKFS